MFLQISIFIIGLESNLKVEIIYNKQKSRSYFVSQTMEEIVPLQYIKKLFHIKIIKLDEQAKIGSTAYYRAVTSYGFMTLIIEHYSESINGAKTIDFLTHRNKILGQSSSCFPLIYQQQIQVNHPQQIVCMTLVQMCQIVRVQQLIQKLQTNKLRGKINKIQKIVKAGMWMKQHHLGIQQNQIKQFYVTRNKHISLNFTQLRPLQCEAVSSQQQINQFYQKYHSKMFKHIVEHLQKIASSYYYGNQQIKQIFFIKDRIYQFKPDFMNKANNYFQLLFFLNLYPYQDVDIQFKPASKNQIQLFPALSKKKSTKNQEVNGIKTKSAKVSKLQGNPILLMENNEVSKNLIFLQGKCINCLVQIFYQEMSQKFIKDSVRHYKLFRTNYVTVRTNEQQYNQQQQKSMEKINNISELKQKQFTQMYLTIFPTISKVELINFLIAYFKCMEPVIHGIVYDVKNHTLSLELVNKLGRHKMFTLLFYNHYALRDQEIAIIIEKSKIKNCKLDLRFLRINDTFLFFLANSEKLAKIQELYLSDCSGLSESGINTLIVSPFCKNLHTLNIISSSSILETAMQVISTKSGLKKLSLYKISAKKLHESHNFQNSINGQDNIQVDVSKMQLQELQMIGLPVNINRTLPKTLKIVKLDQFIDIEDMKNLRHLQLSQLKVKLIQGLQKKSFFSSLASKFNNDISHKNHPLRPFTEGASANTLRCLDLTGSTAKFKLLRPLFFIKSLEKLVLDKCQNVHVEIQPIMNTILNLSVANNPSFTIQHLRTIIHNTTILVQLNIMNTKISKQQLLNFLANKIKKKYINNLILFENQYSNKFIEKSSKNLKSNQVQSSFVSKASKNEDSNFDSIQNVQVVLDRMLKSEQEHILNYMLYKVSESSKTIRLDIFKKHDPMTEIINWKMAKQNKINLMQQVKNSKKKKKRKLSKQIKSLALQHSSIYMSQVEQEMSIYDNQQEDNKDILIKKIHKFVLLQEEVTVQKLKNLYIQKNSYAEIEQVQQSVKQLETASSIHYRQVLSCPSNDNNFLNLSPRVKLPVLQSQSPIRFMVGISETIDKVTYRFVDLVKNYSSVTNPIQISLKDNKLLDSNVMKMFIHFGQQRVRSIDFRNCLFGYEEVIEDIFHFPWLQQINNSQYQINLNKDNFISNSQRYLKLFMRLKPIRKIKINVRQTQEIQILYSVLYHILDQHSMSITSLTIRLQNIIINSQSQLFLQKIFELTDLQQLNLSIVGCFIKDQRFYKIWHQKINNLTDTLTKLKLLLPSHDYPVLKLTNLVQLQLQFSDEQIQQNMLHKCIKHIYMSPNLQTLKILVPNSKYISNLSKLFGSGVPMGNGLGSNLLQKLPKLQNLSLNFQYCSLKQLSILEFIQSLGRCNSLKMIDLNLNFTVSNLNDLIGCISDMLNHATHELNMRIICVNQNSANFVYDRQTLAQHGIQLIL